MNVCDHRLYSIWRGMKTRCYNPRRSEYDRYGGRGIVVCGYWKDSFTTFASDMYPTFVEGLTLDRIDNSLGYSKENCRWATIEEQNNNQEREYTSIMYKGIEYTEARLSKICGVPRTTLQRRRLAGYTDREVVCGKDTRKYVVDGGRYNLKELSQLFGTSPQNLCAHLKRGKTLGDMIDAFM